IQQKEQKRIAIHELQQSIETLQHDIQKNSLEKKQLESTVDTTLHLKYTKQQQIVVNQEKIVTAIQYEIESLTKQCKQTKQALDKQNKHHAMHRQYEQHASWLRQQFIPLNELIEQHVLQSLYNECNTYFSQWFSVLMDNDTLQAQLSVDFSPLISQNGYDTPMEALSGGERTSVALAYRLALHQVVHSMIDHIHTRDMLMLD